MHGFSLRLLNYMECMMREPFNQYQGYIFDLDGTVYRGDEVIEGAAEVINQVIESGKPLYFVSNKTTGSITEYHGLLTDQGIKAEPWQIINATVVASEYLKRECAGRRFYAVGEWVFIKEIEGCGLKYSEDPRKVEILLVTLDRECTFHKMELAARCLENGARFLAANIDTTCPVEGGTEIWDAGSTIAALERRTKRKLELSFGKPSGLMIEAVNNRLQLPPEKILMIGDRLETDVLMAHKAGFHSVLVQSGVKNFDADGEFPQPTYQLSSIADMG